MLVQYVYLSCLFARRSPRSLSVAGDLMAEAFTGVVEAVSTGAAEAPAEADPVCRPRRARAGDIRVE
jgi:hypothetical protein